MGVQDIAAGKVKHEIDIVFSVCTSRDIDVWEHAAKYMVCNLSARDFVVLVPQDDVNLFLKVTPPEFRVLSEEEFLSPFREKLKTALINSKNGSRLGWYLQQILKLSYLESVSDEDLLLIWDADTIPLRTLNFVGEQGEVLYYKGSEYHSPYFSNISKLLGMERSVSFSFIAQCFAIRGRWAREFFLFIQDRHQCHWVDAILKSIDCQESSGFSEYEVLGTFISNRHPDSWRAIDEPWQRYGNGLIGGARYLNTMLARRQLRKYHFTSFESWDKPYSAQPRWIRWFLQSYNAVHSVMLPRGRQ